MFNQFFQIKFVFNLKKGTNFATLQLIVKF